MQELKKLMDDADNLIKVASTSKPITEEECECADRIKKLIDDADN